VGVGTAVGMPDEHIALTVLSDLLSLEINMQSIVIIGNTHSKSINHWFVTQRGYAL
jgi:precorrin-3B methylase